MVVDLETRRSELQDAVRCAVFDLEDAPAPTALEMMVMALARALETQ